MKKNKKQIAIIAALLFSVVFSIIYKWIQTGNPFRVETVVFGIVILLNLLILGSLGSKIFRDYSTQPIVQLKKKIILSFIFFVLAALLISFSLVCLGVCVLYLLKGLDASLLPKQLFFVEFPSAIKHFSIWISTGSIFFFYVIWRQAIDREQLLREETLKYKYRNLKTQVNPHFLFNSLNTLSEMIYTDTKKADNYIRKLSGIYRYILENEEADLIPMDKELEFVKQYLELQKERADDKLQIDINFPNADKFKIIPVSLQILVENTLKHNVMSEETPLEIWIYAESRYIVVSNPIRRKNILDNSSQTGLSNLGERVKLVMGKDMIVKQENDMFLVQLPIVSM
jgi:hypothetical protein